MSLPKQPKIWDGLQYGKVLMRKTIVVGRNQSQGTKQMEMQLKEKQTMEVRRTQTDQVEDKGQIAVITKITLLLHPTTVIGTVSLQSSQHNVDKTTTTKDKTTVTKNVKKPLSQQSNPRPDCIKKRKWTHFPPKHLTRLQLAIDTE